MIVDHDEIARRRLGRELAEGGFARVAIADSPDAAQVALDGCAALLIAVAPDDDGTAMTLVHAAAQLADRPAIFVMGRRPAARLADALFRAGADAFLEPPVGHRVFRRAYRRLCDGEGVCEPAVGALVGRAGLKDAQWLMRGVMGRSALDGCSGSQRVAAGTLDVDRRYVARLADEFRATSFVAKS